MSVEAICVGCGTTITRGTGTAYSRCGPCAYSYRSWYEAGGRSEKKCHACAGPLPPRRSKFCSDACRLESCGRAVRCPLIPDKRLKPFVNQPEWLRVAWPRPARIPYGRKVIRRTCVNCASTFRGMPHESRCQVCPPYVQLGKIHGPSVRQIGPLFGPKQPHRLECEWCNLAFWSTVRRRFCSNGCMRINNSDRPAATEIHFGSCVQCGDLFVRPAHHAADTCSPTCSRRRAKYQRRHLKRVKNGGEVFTLREIAERDGWCCHLCGKKVPDRQYAARDDDPTIDHLVPVSEGGAHTKANVALAHNRCNWERGAEGVAQLRLVG